MESLQIQNGFTLIEIVIVSAIIGILVALVTPTYNQYIKKSQYASCLSEVKSYSNNVFYILNDQDDGTVPISPILNACQSITDATGWTLITQQQIIAVTPAPHNARIECDIVNGNPCKILP